MSVSLQDLQPCFQGVVPSLIATCSADGEPNVTYLSQVYYVDPEHVALSCQFFNKTRRNVEQNPHATIVLYDPVSFEAWRLTGRFLRAETAGPLFDTMAARIQVIASHSGMAGVFRLLSADVYRVTSLERIDGFLLPPDVVTPTPDLAAKLPGADGPLTELRGLQVVSDRIARASNLEEMLHSTLAALDELLGFRHAMVLLHEEPCRKLVAIASRGYGPGGIGAEVALGDGVIGTAAQRRRMVRVAGVDAELSYGRAIRERALQCGSADLPPEIPLPGLPDAKAQLALPMLVGDRLVGVLAVESRDPLSFDEWDEAFLQIVANQIAIGMDRMQDDDEETVAEAPRAGNGHGRLRPKRSFVFYRNDDCVFVDGEYLIRNVPGRILWKLLCQHQQEARVQFTNRELRLDPSLGLPPLKDNLESRLILLRRRLQEKCPDVAMVPVRRGRFELRVDCELELVEKDSA